MLLPAFICTLLLVDLSHQCCSSTEPGSETKVAFTAIKKGPQTGNLSALVTFDEILTNVGGNFDLSTHSFTCTVPGTYVIFYSVAVSENIDPIIGLIRNGEIVVQAHTHTQRQNFATSANAAILNLAVGDKLELRFVVHTNPTTIEEYTTFSGLLYNEQ